MFPSVDSFDDENDSVDTDYFYQAISLPPTAQEGNQASLASPSTTRKRMDFEMPPQLHPACSAGVRRVSSCYFSLASENANQSMTDLLSLTGDNTSNNENNTEGGKNDQMHDSVDFFYHDILMQVFTFLDPNSLLSFSETARRPNFEVFYFLQLQLQQALLLDENSEESDVDNNINRMPETVGNYSASVVSRVARLNMGKAREIVEEYQDSNSTLRTMPLSYSLAYVRHYLLRNGFHNKFSNDSNSNDPNDYNTTADTQSSKIASSQTLASAAIFVTFMGAASIVSSSDAPIAMMTDRLATSELPNVLFRVGFVGSLMRAMSETERGTKMREKAEQMARSMQAMPAALMPARRNHEHQTQPSTTEQKESTRVDNQESQSEAQKTNFVLPTLYEMRHMLQEMIHRNNATERRETRQPLLLDPYAHMPSQQGTNDVTREEDRKEETKGHGNEDLTVKRLNEDFVPSSSTDRKMPSGCVGAYSRSICKATKYVASETNARRKSSFENLSAEEQRLRSLEFLRVCSSNDTLDRVKEVISVMDVNRFYVGNDGNETCALHTAAFRGADKVVEFLCSGIDLQDPRLDGGLCDVNARDNNGWTALHFAAGANSIEAIRVLAHYGADLNVEANNGYTPVQWAHRLSNEPLAEELRKLMSEVGTDHGGASMFSKPLASIANHFFSLIPSQ
eukprot:CAMPEP_0116089516 /NCGR_PEP_ID=MMETSP0327-20121206/6464_1 /TAXON_ID=44447 /ORGANISM="Pseudo-nitzschia delicatissima, Strain B596" /LENGTH=680 /DNA_ID=CAMNT_0003580707 /DNA_START=132 /DNA_END=2174 /DNA_ORIENTATION=+